MSPRLQLICLILAAYFIGGIPFGLIVGRSRGIDPRKAGSGNIGATNLGRLLGVQFFALVFSLDVLKGLLPMLAASVVVHRHFLDPDALVYLLWLLVGLMAIIGHMFSCFIGFKGGKGVSTSAGVVLGLFPFYTWPGLFCLACWAVLFAWSRLVSLASILAAGLFPIAFVVFGLLGCYPLTIRQWPLIFFAALMAAMIIFKHRANIARLRSGTEHRFVGSKASAP
jgi:glycerol-3-phosphate acyltransferase PlsY